jgi:hypothetical protein
MIRVLIVPDDERQPVEERDIDPSLDVFKAILGGWLEGIGGGEEEEWRGYCDEEGKIKGRAVNVRATRLARALGWPTGDVLCGPVVFTGPPDEEGDDTSVTSVVTAYSDALGYTEGRD